MTPMEPTDQMRRNAASARESSTAPTDRTDMSITKGSRVTWGKDKAGEVVMVDSTGEMATVRPDGAEPDATVSVPVADLSPEEPAAEPEAPNRPGMTPAGPAAGPGTALSAMPHTDRLRAALSRPR